MKVFNDYAYYYNAFYSDKDYRAEAEIVNKLINEYSSIRVKNILNLGCGTGRHDVELESIGDYSITGIDLSPQMIEIAKGSVARGHKGPTFYVADIRDYKDDYMYDAVISLFHVMSYQNSNADLKKTIMTAYNSLKQDGVFIFDAWYGPGVLTDRPTVRMKTVSDERNTIIRYANPVMHSEDNVVDVNYDVLIIDKVTSITKNIQETHHMRYFFIPEIRYMLEENGFQFIKCVDCNTLGDTDFNTWTAFFVAKKKG